MDDHSASTALTRLISGREVQARTSLSRVTIWRRVRAGDFPAAVSLGANRIAWREAEVTAWINALSTTRGFN